VGGSGMRTGTLEIVPSTKLQDQLVQQRTSRSAAGEAWLEFKRIR
jgi:hypothetical protein